MSKKSFIDSVEVKTPCTEDWDEMSGNDRVRFCSHSAKDVNNLSEMTRKQANGLVRASGGNLCIRYIPDPVTHRPMFAEQLLQITRRTPRLTAGVMSASLSLSSMAYAQGSPEPTPTPTPVVAAASPQAGQSRDESNVSSEITTRELVPLPQVINTVTMGLVAVSTSLRYEPKNALTRAVLNEDIDEVRELIAGGANVNGKEGSKRTPLFAAIETGDVEIVRLLLDFGARVNARDDEKQTPLMQIDDDATPELIEVLVTNGVKLNLIDDGGNTALISAAGSVEAAVLKTLIDAGADVKLKNKKGQTALMNAAEDDDLEKVRMLLIAGAEVNARNEDGDNAWDLTGDEDIEQLLVSYGAIVDEDDGADNESDPSR